MLQKTVTMSRMHHHTVEMYCGQTNWDSEEIDAVCSGPKTRRARVCPGMGVFSVKAEKYRDLRAAYSMLLSGPHLLQAHPCIFNITK